MATERSAGAVVYRLAHDGSPLFLLLQPAPGKPWGFPKGKIDDGETVEEAARREIAEESGLTDVAFDPDFRLIIHYNYRRGRLLIRKEVVYFLACSPTIDVRISWEHVAYRWAALEESFELVQYENAREALKQACNHLRDHHQITCE